MKRGASYKKAVTQQMKYFLDDWSFLNLKLFYKEGIPHFFKKLYLIENLSH